MNEKGIGMRVDVSKAIEYYQQASEQGEGEANAKFKLA